MLLTNDGPKFNTIGMAPLGSGSGIATKQYALSQCIVRQIGHRRDRIYKGQMLNVAAG